MYIRNITIIGLLVTGLFFSCKSGKQYPIIDYQLSHPYKSSVQITTELDTSSLPWASQLAAWEYSYIGEYQKALATWNKGYGKTPEISTEELEAFNSSHSPQNAIDYILEAASKHDVTIINEAHHQPLHRVFTRQLLQDLYQLGYKNLGIETLSHKDTALNTRGYPFISSGSYSLEPQYGDLIREALKIGYHLFPYESQEGDREISQATQIYEQIQQRPDEKFLIHCGFAHVVEGEYPAWGKAMAGRLKDMSGKDPLTINQEMFTESAEGYSKPLFKALTLEQPTVFINEEGASYKDPKHPDWYDILVFHPSTTFEHGRPSWLLNGGKEWFEINMTDLTTSLSYPLLALIYEDGEDITKAVPLDIVAVDSAQTSIYMAIRPGAYQLVLQDDNESGVKRKIEFSN